MVFLKKQDVYIFLGLNLRGYKKFIDVVVPTEDLIGIKSIVNNLATNPNASVREAAVASLGYVSKPEHKQNLTELLQYAAKDSDAGVRAQVDKQMQKVSA